MPQFSKASSDRLATCDQRLQDLFNAVIDEVDCTVLVGHRGREEQEKAFSEGHSKLHWPDGKHNKMPSMAVDVSPYPVNWNETARWVAFSEIVLAKAATLGISLRWGGDWDGRGDGNPPDALQDLPHYELISKEG